MLHYVKYVAADSCISLLASLAARCLSPCALPHYRASAHMPAPHPRLHFPSGLPLARWLFVGCSLLASLPCPVCPTPFGRGQPSARHRPTHPRVRCGVLPSAPSLAPKGAFRGCSVTAPFRSHLPRDRGQRPTPPPPSFIPPLFGGCVFFSYIPHGYFPIRCGSVTPHHIYGRKCWWGLIKNWMPQPCSTPSA